MTSKNTSGQEINRVEYNYDAEDHLIRRRVFLSSSTPSQQNVFVYDGGQVALQFDKSTSGNLAAADLNHRYLWGPAVDQLLADEDLSNLTSPGTILWPLADHLGTVRDWINSSGAVLDHVEYDSFGRRVDTTVAVDAAFGWTGRYRDPLTGLQYNDARWYNPAIQRWMSEDPIGFAGGDANLNRYVGNEPTSYVDPDGLAKEMHTHRGKKNGRPGTYYQWEYYDRVWIFWKGNGRLGPLQFDPDVVPGVPNVGNGSVKRCGEFARIANGAGQAGEAAEAAVVIAAIGIPGPEDVVIAGGARLGYEVAKQGGRWIIKLGGKILTGADEAAAARKIADAMRIERHHNLPREFVREFSRAGLCIEDFVEDLSKLQHRLKPGGLHTGPNNWNALWAEFFKTIRNPTRQQILDELNRIRKMHGLPPLQQIKGK